MHAKHVKEIMVPLDEYTIVNEDETLYDAFLALKESRNNLKQGQYVHRAVLVVNKKGRIVGKLGHLGFLRALEPKYKLMGDLDLDMISKAGLNKEFITSMMHDFGLWQDELDNVRSKSKKILMKEIMRPTKENIDINATMNEAIHKIVMYQMLSILVTQNDIVVGIVRVSDIYDELSRNILGD